MELPRPSVDAALEMIRASLSPLSSETIPITSAQGRITTIAVRAQIDVPGFRASAMDGYACRSTDTTTASNTAPVLLPLGAEISAGSPPGELNGPLASPISTGAALPDGADCVVPLERVTRHDGKVVIDEPLVAGRNVRNIGEDARRGSTVLASHTRVTPDAIGGLIAYGVHTIDVCRKPNVALLTTGSELAECGEPLSPGRIYDCNGPMLAAAIRALGLDCTLGTPVPDTLSAISTALEAAIASNADMLITSGGASTGRHDLIHRSLLDRGATILFRGIRMRPGKPLLFALLPDGRPVFGLPGNPVAAAVGFRFFVTAALRSLIGLPAERGIPVDHEPVALIPGTTHLLRCIPHLPASGMWTVNVLPDQRSHVMSSMISAQGWVLASHTLDRSLFFPKEPFLG